MPPVLSTLTPIANGPATGSPEHIPVPVSTLGVTGLGLFCDITGFGKPALGKVCGKGAGGWCPTPEP